MSYINWQWANEHVQADVDNGEYVSSESTLVLAGPSRLDMLTPGDPTGTGFAVTNSLIPIGLVQGMQVMQGRPVDRLFEIGSKRAYLIPGRHMANLSIERLFFYGPSLLRMLYALAPIGPGQQLGNFGTPLVVDPDENGEPVSYLAAYNKLFPNSPLKNPPGWGALASEGKNRDYWNNLTSEITNVPFGMAVIFKDTKDRPYGAYYLEDVFIESYSQGVSAATVVMGESVQAQFDRAVPIQIATLG